MPSSSNGLLILPLVLWDKRPPDCHISSLIVSESEKYILTGTSSGHIITWDFNINEVIIKSFLNTQNKGILLNLILRLYLLV
jgi:hypothetical protein